MLIPKLGTFLAVLQLYLSPDWSLQRALHIVSVVVALYPLFRLHENQHRAPRQPPETGWMRSIKSAVRDAFKPELEHPDLRFLGANAFAEMESTLGARLATELPQIYKLLGMDGDSEIPFSMPDPPVILCTQRTTCVFCADPLHPSRLLREQTTTVPLLAGDFRWKTGLLAVARCGKCRAQYYPDKITYANGTRRLQRLECDALHLRVSKHGIWVDRRIARAQENGVVKFHSGWSNFADWLNDTVEGERKLTVRQSKRLYLEHFSRRLVFAHGITQTIEIPAHCDGQALSETVCDAIGRNGGLAPGAMLHGCTECTHLKQYAGDLAAEVLDGADNDVVGSDVPAEPINEEDQEAQQEEIGANLPTRPAQYQRTPGTKRGYTRMAVMDGKTITHRICAVDRCEGPLVNYKNGRFCYEHLGLRLICGFAHCDRPIDDSISGAVTCNQPAHKAWHKKWLARFGRLSFPGVQRVMQQQNQEGNSNTAKFPQLSDLDGIPGSDIAHTFRARTTYCLQTVQWSCGCPIGWGKCYVTESPSRALGIINRLWESDPESRPAFMVYDEACNLLRHIITQDPQSPWLKTTKFIVDIWHYIGHRATDVLCRVWCNPAPSNGSQPDLIRVTSDANGTSHKTRAFNTETAEQFNSWLNGYEAQMRQMSDVSYGFTVHVLMLLYKEIVEKRNKKKHQDLDAEFWAQVESTN